MKEFILTQEETERTVLVGLITNTQNEAKANEYLDELLSWQKRPERCP
jgi:GTP-binding protein HflX